MRVNVGGRRFRFEIGWHSFAAAGSPVPAPSHRTRRNGAPAWLVVHAKVKGFKITTPFDSAQGRLSQREREG